MPHLPLGSILNAMPIPGLSFGSQCTICNLTFPSKELLEEVSPAYASPVNNRLL